jgi:2-deoxy-D-gluconate 3-dehydrogenase
VDVTDASSVEKLAEECFGRLERVDILINAAGVFTQTPTASLTLAEWRSVLDTNLTGTFISCQAFGLRMAAGQGGRIVNFASTDAFFGVPGEAAYCSSKGGVVQLTRALAVEWISANVRVNAVAPSDFVTPMLEPYLADEKYVARVRAGIPIGRFGQAEDIAGAVVFLSSHASAMVVGECLMVDGGRTAR